MRQILCYGDSNTWGHNPDYTCMEDLRYPYEVRWTSRLEALLGEDYRVLAQGLCSRTTCFDDPVEEGKNGMTFYPVCLESAMPVELVVFMLGTNDVRPLFHAPAEEILRGMERLGVLTERICRESGRKVPEILIVAPAAVGEQVEEREFAGVYDRTSVEKSRKLPALYQAVADRHGWGFLNASDVVGELGKDCVHLTPSGHLKLAEAVYEKIKEMRELH
jgi:lysophospholipase L1-like esterase